MVIGEEFIIGKLIEALIYWFNKEKSKKEVAHKILTEIKLGLKSIPLHMDLSKQYGQVDTRKFLIYLPIDIENLHQILIRHQSELDAPLCEELLKYIDHLVEYHTFLNSPEMGRGIEETKRENNVRETIQKLIDAIDKLLKE